MLLVNLVHGLLRVLLTERLRIGLRYGNGKLLGCRIVLVSFSLKVNRRIRLVSGYTGTKLGQVPSNTSYGPGVPCNEGSDTKACTLF